MSRGTNVVTVSGHVAGDIIHGSTKTTRVPACSFMLTSQRNPKSSVFIRINVYGNQAIDCERLQKGDYIIVEGELMNRKDKMDDDLMVEVRGDNVIFVGGNKQVVRQEERVMT